MGIYSKQFFVSEGFDFKIITKEMVGVGFLFSLPFRLKFGELYRHHFQFRGKAFEIVLKNKFSIPKNADFIQVILAAKGIEALFTDAFIVVKHPKITDETLEGLRGWTPEQSDIPPIDSGGSISEAMEALNRFIIAYSTATRELIGLRLFRINDFFEYLTCEMAIYYQPHAELTDDDYNKLFNLHPVRKIILREQEQIFDDLHDLPVAETRDGIAKYLKGQEDFIHFELAFEAKTKMFGGDYIGALLLAVAAFEGAYAAFVQNELRSRLPDEIKASPEEFIKELGMSLCNQFTPFLLLSEDERPDAELILKAGKGLKYRNEIMHSLRNRGGEYRIRTRTNSEISEAYSAVLKVYDCYVQALEKRSQKAAPNQELQPDPR